jgi:hypothetical protein
MRTDTETLAEAMDILARDIESEDGAANAAIAMASTTRYRPASTLGLGSQ